MIAPDTTASASKLKSKGSPRQLWSVGWRLAQKPGFLEKPGFSAASTQDELLQRMAVGRHESAVAAGGHDHFADVQGPTRIEANIMRGEEVARGAGIRAAAPAREQFAV